MECLDDSNLPAGRRITTAAVLLVALLLLQLRGFLPGASPSGARHTAKYLPVLHNGAMMFNESAPLQSLRLLAGRAFQQFVIMVPSGQCARHRFRRTDAASESWEAHSVRIRLT